MYRFLDCDEFWKSLFQQFEMDFDMLVLSILMVLLVSGTFLRTTHTTVRGNLVRLRKPGSSKRIFSMFVTQMAMPTPFLVANFDQKKPTRWAPLINYWKAMVPSHLLNQYFICHISYVTYHMPYNKCEICYEQETCKN